MATGPLNDGMPGPYTGPVFRKFDGLEKLPDTAVGFLTRLSRVMTTHGLETMQRFGTNHFNQIKEFYLPNGQTGRMQTIVINGPLNVPQVISRVVLDAKPVPVYVELSRKPVTTEEGTYGLFAFRVPVEQNNLEGEYRYFMLEPNEGVQIASNLVLVGQQDNWRLFEIEYFEPVDGTPLYSMATKADNANSFVSTLVNKTPLTNEVIGSNTKNIYGEKYAFYGKESENIFISVSGDGRYDACLQNYPRFENGQLTLEEPDNAHTVPYSTYLCASKFDAEGYCTAQSGESCGEVTWMRDGIKNVADENRAKTPIISPELGMYMDWRFSLEYQGPIYFGPNHTLAEIRCGQYPDEESIYGATAYAMTVSGVTLDQCAVMLEVLEKSVTGYEHKWFGYYADKETDLTELLDSIDAYNLVWVREEDNIYKTPYFIFNNPSQYGTYNLCENFNYASTFMILQRAYAGELPNP